MTSINQIIQRAKQQPRLGSKKKAEYKPTSRTADVTQQQEGQREAQLRLDALAQGMKDANLDISSLIKSYDALADSIKSTTDQSTQLQMGMGKLIGVFDAYTKNIITTVQQSTWLEQRNKELNSSFGVTTATAAKLGQAYDNMAVTLMISGEQVRKYAQSLNKIIPGMSGVIAKHQSYGEELMMTQNIMKDQLGLSEEQAQGFELYARGLGRSGVEQLGMMKAITAQFEEATGMAGMFKDVSGEIASLGSDIRQAYGKIPGSLELAVMKSRTLGMSFSQMEAAATKMLNIEESVNDELEYQLVSGKRLADANGNSLTEKLRMAKITGDANKIAEATTEIFETQSDVLKGNNYFAKEALAKTMGMTTDQLMKAYETQKLIKSIPEFQGEAGQKKLEDLVKMQPDDFAKQIASMPQDKQDLYKEIKKTADTRTTDQKLEELLGYERTFKITQVAPDQVSTITGAQNKILSGDLQTQMRNFLDTIMGKDSTIAKTLGGLQIDAKVYSDFSTALSDFSKLMPIFGKTISNVIDKLKAFVVEVLGGKVEDAVMVNDAMIQFHPADKFATVPDGAALLASTERGKLDSAVDTLTGGGGKTAVVDPNPIARAVAAAVQQAMADMKIEMDGFNLAKALKFSNRTINRI